MKKIKFPPEVIIFEKMLELEARNCYDAAMLRNIKLCEELKTLIFQWRNEIHVFNLLGNEEVRFLHDEYKLMPESILKRYELQAGTINPYSAVQQLPIIDYTGFSSSVFTLEWVYTNDGSLRGTSKIPTWILKRDFPNARIYDYVI